MELDRRDEHVDATRGRAAKTRAENPDDVVATRHRWNARRSQMLDEHVGFQRGRDVRQFDPA